MKDRVMRLLSVTCVSALLFSLLPTPCAYAAETTTTEESDAAEDAGEDTAQEELTGEIPSHISIAGTDASGMSAEEAEAIVDDYVAMYEDVTFTLTVEDRSIEADSGDLGLHAKNDDVVERALKYGQEGNLIARYKAQRDMENGKTKDFALTLTSDIPTTAFFLESHKGELVTEAVDNTVKREDGRFVYVEGSPGTELLSGKSATKIADYLATEWDGGDVSLELLTQKDTPRGSEEELSTISDVLGSFHTDFGTVINGRTNNIKVGASKLDGVVLYPGETISVAQTIGPTTAENGYFLAGSYENGTTVDTYGGGICQVSTTLYNAVLMAELEIVTRAAHSMVVSYVEPSKDAAIADGVKDFQFKNNQKTPIYIEGYTQGGNLYFNIYGKETRDPGHRVEFISEITSQTDPEKEYVAVGDQPVGYYETTTQPHIGYTARLWKVVYENGAEVSRKVINNSKYNPSSEIISIGVAGAPPEGLAAISAAMETKDEAAVRAAIAQWTPEAIAARQQQEAAQNAQTTQTTQTQTQTPAQEQKPQAETGGTATTEGGTTN